MTSIASRAHASQPCEGRRFFQPWLVVFVLLCAALLSACSDDDGPAPPVEAPMQPPAGLSYHMPAASYVRGEAIAVNLPSASGGAIERYSVAPPLPAGLRLDEATGAIIGTPTTVTAAAHHVVTATNRAGSATARIQIEVRDGTAAPVSLAYSVTAVSFTVGDTIAPIGPTSSGGAITHYSITPALPAGLAFDAQTGVISGTPAATAAPAPYVVTGTNSAGSVTVELRIEVQAAIAPPASFQYASPVALYVAGEAIVANTPQVTGGPVASYSVSPPLPAGLSLNTQTGVIAGTPQAVQMQASYTVTATNRAGSLQAQVRIAVTARGSWVPEASMLQAKHYHSATLLTDGRVLAVGGIGAMGPTGAAALYDRNARTWTATGSLASARYEHTATRLQNGKVLVAGGAMVVGTAIASAELYDPTTGTWSPAGSMAAPRLRHTATLLPDGKVLVIGGNQGMTFEGSAELYDPALNTWTRLGTTLATPRTQHAATLLPDGATVLVVGGISSRGMAVLAEQFPINGMGPTVTVPFPGTSHVLAQSVLLANGKVLVVGDFAGPPQAWLYDPIGSVWTPSAMSERRVLPALTLLADGRVLAAGGYGMASAEIYHPGADTWTAAAAMSVPRSGAAAAMLPDGSVLVSGGTNGTTELDAVERYVP
ncbi:kelch-like protein [Cupriavidus necator]|uniref:putative Ig domain-containing protein n=1 Tax=Cupriavidus necator TaxID=106590 RepID=UPI00148F4A64|nr:putative Ig domain-containing protein [Cupriavidus necator]NOV22356.1 kelch-like protein [Cupriavidus necator]